VTDEEDNKQWVEAGRRYSPFDDEAVSLYLEKRAHLDPEKKAKFDAAWEKALDEGWRPKHAVKRAIAALEAPPSV
jgi:hypothetical protein